MAWAMDSALSQKLAKREGFVAVAKTMAGVGRLTRICKDVIHVADIAQQTCPSESSEMLGGPGADFLRGGDRIENEMLEKYDRS